MCPRREYTRIAAGNPLPCSWRRPDDPGPGAALPRAGAAARRLDPDRTRRARRSCRRRSRSSPSSSTTGSASRPARGWINLDLVWVAALLLCGNVLLVVRDTVYQPPNFLAVLIFWPYGIGCDSEAYRTVSSHWTPAARSGAQQRAQTGFREVTENGSPHERYRNLWSSGTACAPSSPRIRAR
jgi:hypothetical protein